MQIEKRILVIVDTLLIALYKIFENFVKWAEHSWKYKIIWNILGMDKINKFQLIKAKHSFMLCKISSMHSFSYFLKLELI